MKAVLVIDLPVALVHLLGKEVFMQMSHRDGRYIMTVKSTLKLLPQKKPTKNIIWKSRSYDYFDEGFNSCLKEITGETE